MKVSLIEFENDLIGKLVLIKIIISCLNLDWMYCRKRILLDFFYDIKINVVTLYCNLCSDIVNM